MWRGVGSHLGCGDITWLRFDREDADDWGDGVLRAWGYLQELVFLLGREIGVGERGSRGVGPFVVASAFAKHDVVCDERRGRGG